MTNPFGLIQEDGWTGVFTHATAPGAIPSGSRFVKVLSEANDGHPTGSKGTVLGSIETPEEIRAMYPDVAYFYFVEFDDSPRLAVGIMSTKIKAE